MGLTRDDLDSAIAPLVARLSVIENAAGGDAEVVTGREFRLFKWLGAFVLTTVVAGFGLLYEQISDVRVGVERLYGEVLREIHGLRETMQTENAGIRSEMEARHTVIKGQMHSEIGSIRKEMAAQHAATTEQIHAGLASVRKEMAANHAETTELMHAGHASIRKEMEAKHLGTTEQMHAGLASVRKEMETKHAAVTQQMHAGFASIREEISTVRERVARVETLLERGNANDG